MRLIVVGTGTDIGKTHVSACLLGHARSRGVSAEAYKPIATGITDTCEDADRLAEALGRPSVAPTFSYAEPISPHLAARNEGRPIELEPIAARAEELARGVDVLLVESAGGLFSPLGEHENARAAGNGFRAFSNADLVRALLPAVVLLVAPDRLGVLHDVSATMIAASAVGLEVAHVVLSRPEIRDRSTDTNGPELERLGIARVLGVFPRAPFDARESREVASKVWSALFPPA